MASFSVVSLIAIVPDKEGSTPTLIVSGRTGHIAAIRNRQIQIRVASSHRHLTVEKAKHLIRKDTKPDILQIAFDSGFNSKSAFYAAFKKATGVTPTQSKRKNL